MHTARILFMCLVLIAGFAVRSIAREIEQITCTGKVVGSQGRPVAGAKVGLYILILSMDTFSFDVELSQQTVTNDDGNFIFETMAESNDANIQTVILADKEGLALGWATGLPHLIYL